MSREPHERKSSVERLKDALYSRKAAIKTDPAARTSMPHEREHTPHMWEDIHAGTTPPAPPSSPAPDPLLQDRTLPPLIAQKIASQVHTQVMPRIPHPKKPRRSRIALYFLGLALVFFLAAAGAAAYLLLMGGNTISAQNIDLSVVAPSLVDSGKPAVIQYVISNRNQETLRLGSLVVTYPAGTRMAANMTQDLPQERLPVGDIPPGGQVIKTSSAVFFGAEGSAQAIRTTLEYRLSGSNAIFTKEGETSFIIGSSPISVSAAAPDEAISGQEFNMDLTVTSNATAPLKNVGLQAQVPFGWELRSAAPVADVGGVLWRLGDFMPGESKTVSLSGILTGSDGDTRVFHFQAGVESDLTAAALSVPLITSPLTITVRKPFISGLLSVEGKTGGTVSVPLGSGVHGEIAWQNNLPDDASHVVFTLKLSGMPLDTDSISTSGFYDSSKSQVVWSEQTDSSLGTVAPGDRGRLQFGFKTLPPSVKLLSNPFVNLALEIVAVRTGQGNVQETVTSAATMKVKLASTVTLGVAAVHFVGVFKNSGPMPPLSSQTTTYTVLWTVKNSSNDVGNGVVKATLPPYVQFVGAGSDTSISYDAASRSVTWNLGNIAIGTGYTAPARTAAFQISLTPSVTQRGQLPALTSEATFAGQDRYAGIAITASAVAPTTRLTEDPEFVQGMEMVR